LLLFLLVVATACCVSHMSVPVHYNKLRAHLPPTQYFQGLCKATCFLFSSVQESNVFKVYDLTITVNWFFTKTRTSFNKCSECRQ